MALAPILSSDAVSKDLASGSVTILGGLAVHAAGIDLKAGRFHHFTTPAGWSASDITFLVSDDDVTYTDLYDKNGEVKIPAALVAASRTFVLDLPTFFGIRCVKIRSGTGAAPVNQAADRTITYGTVPR